MAANSSIRLIGKWQPQCYSMHIFKETQSCHSSGLAAFTSCFVFWLPLLVTAGADGRQDLLRWHGHEPVPHVASVKLHRVSVGDAQSDGQKPLDFIYPSLNFCEAVRGGHHATKLSEEDLTEACGKASAADERRHEQPKTLFDYFTTCCVFIYIKYKPVYIWEAFRV